MNVNLSKRQYSLLEVFVEGVTHLNIPSAMQYDQRPFRSLLLRGWVSYSPRHGGFRATKDGREAWQEFRHANIQRHNPTRPLTAYFDPTQFGLGDIYHQRTAKSDAA